jgi:hypothetical protein
MKRISTSLFVGVLFAMVNSCGQSKTETESGAATGAERIPQPSLGHRSAKLVEADGLQFKDLNHNGQLDKYEDWRLTPEERSQDLLSKMTLEEKAVMLLIADMRMYNEAFMLETSSGGDQSRHQCIL